MPEKGIWRVFSANSSSFSSTPLLSTSSNALIPQNLLKRSVKPSIRSLNLLLSFLLKNWKLALILETFSQISSNSIQVDSTTHFIVARALLRSHRYEEAELFIFSSEKYDFAVRRSLWESLVRGFCVFRGDVEKALSLLQECVRKQGILPSPNTFRSLVRSFCFHGRMDRAIEVLEMMTCEKVGYHLDNFVCSSIISGFSRIGKSELGLGFFDRMQNSQGFKPNLLTYTAVVDALCREGRIDEASELVHTLEKNGMVLDAVLYTCWICGYFREGLLMEGFQKHKLMYERGVIPDVVSYTALVDGFCKEGHVEKVIGLIKDMEKNGLKPNLVTYTTIIQGFCSRYKIEEALFVFRKMKESDMVVDEFVYSILINGLCANGKMDSVFDLLEEMDIKGIKAGPVTYNTVVNGLCKAGKTNQADKFSRTYFGDNFTYSTLLHGYMKENDSQGVIETKRRLEQAGIPLDVVTANILIKAFFLVGMVNDACSLFQGMSEKGLAANSITYLTMVDGYWKHGMIDKAVDFFEEYKKTPFINAACHCRMIVGLCKEGKIEMATKLFLELSEKHLISSTTAYTTLMKFLFKNGNGEGVLRFITQIEHSDPERLSYIWNDAIAFLCWRACFPAALETYILMRMKGLMVWSNSYYVLLKGLMKSRNGLIIKLLIGDYLKACGLFDPRLVNIICLHLCKKNVDDAVRFLSGMSRRSISLGALTVVVNTLKEKDRVQDALKFLLEAEENGLATNVFVYSIVVDGLCKEGFLEKALDLCIVMRRKRIIPNIATYNSVIHGLCRQGCFVEAFRIFYSLECSGLFPTIVTYATLIGALSGEGLLQDAKELLGRMVTKGIHPNTHIYNCLLNGYCRFGLLEEGLNLFRDLEMNSLLPDCFTISSLLGGYCINGDMQGALNFYNKYKNKGHSPDFLGYLNFIKELITKGRMEEARDIIRDMLHCGETVDLINRAGEGLTFGPLATFLELACKDGRLGEVINILEDVSCKFFSSYYSKSNNSMKGIVKQHAVGSFIKDNEGKACAIGSNNLIRAEAHTSISSFIGNSISNEEKENWKSKCPDTVMNKFVSSQKLPRGDFETYYSIIASFCSKGELQKANGIVKAMFLNSGTAQ